MKKDPITPIYDKLTNAEKAALAFNASLNKDYDSLKFIRDSVPRRTYSQPDIEYADRLGNFYDVLAALSAEFWKHQYFILLWAGRGKIEMAEGDTDRIEKTIGQYHLTQGCLIALQHATETFADQYHLDKYRLCEIIGFDSDDEEITPLEELGEPAQNYYAAMLDLTTARIEQRDTSESTKEYLALN